MGKQRFQKAVDILEMLAARTKGANRLRRQCSKRQQVINTGPASKPAQFGMHAGSGVTQFSHVAQHEDLAPGACTQYR